jgi:predicted flap endonuclease-1-like 5' DNA nuclease/peptidoglycan hydrolase CwlO-like protein
MASPKRCHIAGAEQTPTAYSRPGLVYGRSTRIAGDTLGSVREDSQVEVVLFIVGLAIGVVIGWFVWDRIGSRKLNDDFARRLRHTDDQIKTQRRRADEAEAELEPLRTQLRQMKDERKDLQKQLEKLKGRFDKLKEEKNELDSSVAGVRKRADEADKLQAEVNEKQGERDAAMKEAEDLRLQLGTVDDLRERLTSAQDRLVEAERAKEDARLRAAEAQKVTERATVELEAAMDTISTLRDGAEGALDLQHELDGAKTTISGLESTIGQQSTELAALREQLAASSVVADDRGSTAVEPEDVIVAEPVEHVAIVTEEEIAEPPSEPPSEPSEPPSEPSEPSEPPSEPAEPASIGQPSEEPPVAAAVAEPVGDRDVAVEKMKEIASRTSGGREVAHDDLKKIHGVGPKIEKLLNGMGITSFLQVANFSPEDIETVTMALDAFPGRIERDDWVGSADQLYRDKYETD